MQAPGLWTVLYLSEKWDALEQKYLFASFLSHIYFGAGDKVLRAECEAKDYIFGLRETINYQSHT
jgi:hypothetical protein